MSTTNDGANQKRPITAMDEIIGRLETTVGQSYRNVEGYRKVLGNLENQTLSWEEPKDVGECPVDPGSNTHLNRFMTLLRDLQTTVDKQSEMLEHYQKLI